MPEPENEGRPVVVGVAIALILILFFGLSLGAVLAVTAFDRPPAVHLAALQVRTRAVTPIQVPGLGLLGLTFPPQTPPDPSPAAGLTPTSVPTPSAIATAMLEIARSTLRKMVTPAATARPGLTSSAIRVARSPGTALLAAAPTATKAPEERVASVVEQVSQAAPTPLPSRALVDTQATPTAAPVMPRPVGLPPTAAPVAFQPTEAPTSVPAAPAKESAAVVTPTPTPIAPTAVPALAQLSMADVQAPPATASLPGPAAVSPTSTPVSTEAPPPTHQPKCSKGCGSMTAPIPATPSARPATRP